MEKWIETAKKQMNSDETGKHKSRIETKTEQLREKWVKRKSAKVMLLIVIGFSTDC
jgi:hypothetical protein